MQMKQGVHLKKIFAGGTEAMVRRNADTLAALCLVRDKDAERIQLAARLCAADRATLVLAATICLRPGSVGRVRMRLSEGLAGLVGEQLNLTSIPFRSTP